MTSRQYTIRSIPDKLDKVLRKKAKQSGKSLNAISIEALSRGIGVSEDTVEYTDLDWFIGSKSLDQKAMQETQDWLDTLPSDMSEDNQK